MVKPVSATVCLPVFIGRLAVGVQLQQTLSAYGPKVTSGVARHHL